MTPPTPGRPLFPAAWDIHLPALGRSVNSTVTCLYSAGLAAETTGAAHSLHNLSPARSSVPHDPHTKAAAVMSHGHPTGIHVNIVSPLVNDRVLFRPVIGDTISLEAGMTLVQSCWTMLRSSATTALGPRPFIRRYRKAGDDLVAAARMAHTRRGSFIIPILLPLSDPEPDENSKNEPPLPDMEVTAAPEPLERRVMRTFAESLAALDAVAVKPKTEPREAVHELVRAGVSYQFVSALHRVLTEDAVNEFSAAFDWAPVGDPPKGLREVSIPAAASERIKSFGSRLKDMPAPRAEEQFVGPIRRVERDPDADTGSVTVQTIRNGHPASVAVRVSAAVLDQAWEWARDRKTLVVQSKVRRTSEGLMAETTDAVTPLMLDVPSR